MFDHHLIHVFHKENIKAPHYWPLVREIHRWIPRTKEPQTTNVESISIAWRHPAEVTHAMNLLAPVWPIIVNSFLQTKRSNQNQLFVDIINALHWISTWERSILKLDAYNETIAHNCHQGDNFDLSPSHVLSEEWKLYLCNHKIFLIG